MPETKLQYKPNLAVYSTYCGTLKNLTFCARSYDNYPAYFLTNNPEVLPIAASNDWIPLLIEGMEPSDDPIVSATQAKFAKALPHRFEVLKQFDFLFYVDDKYKLSEIIIPGLAASMRANQSPIAMRLHPWLKPNVLYEYTESLFQKRYLDQRQMMIEYMTAQLNAGLKVEADRHFSTYCILRDMRHPNIATINETWYEHIQACGIECQVSFFFVAQMFKNITILPEHHVLCE